MTGPIARPRIRWASRNAVKRLLALALIGGAAIIASYFTMLRMPGRSHSGPLPPLSDSRQAAASRLRADLEHLAGKIGPRNIFHRGGLRAAEAFLASSLAEAGYDVKRQEFDALGETCSNFEVEIPGGARPGEIVVIGAHYDSVDDSPAANDNGSGTVAVLELARRFARARPDRTLRFVLFVNEEPPFFQTPMMGSLVYAKACRARNDDVVAMLSLETIGWYSDEPGSQQYPLAPIAWLYPDKGDFIAFVGNVASRGLARRAIGTFRKAEPFPSEGAALPGSIAGVGWSDHWSFWEQGYPGVMVTDTAVFRYPHYHSNQDTPDKIDYGRMARVVGGLEAVVADLAGGAASESLQK